MVFVTSLLRRSRLYQGEAWTLVGAGVLPFVVNLGYNLGVGPLSRVDLTPIAFTVSAAVIARALLERRLLRLAPVAFGAVVRGMTDAVLVLDDECRAVEANPAALTLLGWRGGWRGGDLPEPLRAVALAGAGARGTPGSTARTGRSSSRCRSPTCRTRAGTRAAGCSSCAT